MVPDPDPLEFDAVGAAQELGDLPGDASGNESAGAEDGEYVASLEADLEELNALVAKRDAELVAAGTRADQAHAEIEAASHRLAGASAKELEQRTRKILESFLPVVDDIDRAIIAAMTHAEHADVVTGMELVRRSLLTQLGKYGVTHAPALGEPFDPRRHEAIALVPVTDPAQDGRVIDVMRQGYLIGDDTLRPAGVAVGKHAG
ncbi:MAG: nucleotide exchange factor GrpE [Myxococcota bacterium]|nr:nucleotide exchange factor GrpE [Myxococcota bacterium]